MLPDVTLGADNARRRRPPWVPTGLVCSRVGVRHAGQVVVTGLHLGDDLLRARVATTQRYTAVSTREIRAVSAAAKWRIEAIDRLDPFGTR